jgi:ketosteroid isomerase-like protein
MSSNRWFCLHLLLQIGRTFVKIIGFVIVMLIAAPVFGAEPLPDEKQILKLEDDWVRALVTHDRDVLDRIVAPGFTFIEPDGTVKNRAEYLADRSSNEAETESFKNNQLKVEVFGNSALASGLATIVERRDGKRYRFSLRWKELWRQESGRRQVLASQATPVNPNWDAPFAIKQ